MLRILFHIHALKGKHFERANSLFFCRSFCRKFFGEECCGGEASYLPGKGGSNE
jgi:hypothetical protein